MQLKGRIPRYAQWLRLYASWGSSSIPVGELRCCMLRGMAKKLKSGAVNKTLSAAVNIELVEFLIIEARDLV